VTTPSRVGGTTNARVWYGGHVEARRRKRLLSPWIAVLCLMMTTATFLFVVAPLPTLASGPVHQSPDCIPCPGGGGRCEPNCGGPTYDWVTFFSADLGAAACVSSWVSGSCSGCDNPIEYGQQFEVVQGTQVTVSSCAVGGGLEFSEWLTNSGPLGSATSSSTSLTVITSASLWLIDSASTGANYLGYVLNYEGMTVTSVSSELTIPTPYWYQCSEIEGGDCPNIDIANYGTIYNAEVASLWVGLTGYQSGNSEIWQAGVDVIAGTTFSGSQIRQAVPWYEAVSGSSGSTMYLYGDIDIGFGDTVSISVSQQSSTYASFKFTDDTNGQSYLGGTSFDAPTANAEWILETPGFSGGYVVMPSLSPSPVFSESSADITSCSHNCPTGASSLEAAVYADSLLESYTCGWTCSITESGNPSLLSSPYNSFTG
jgi:hypothetical protein